VSPQASPLAPLPFGTRLWFAWACFFRVLFDGRFAADCFAARTGPPALPAPPPSAPTPPPQAPTHEAALQLLALFQREGRLVDFLEQDVTAFPDAEVGAAARVVHQGCRKALHAHARLVPVREEEEGTRVTLPQGFSPSEVKLSGNVAGSGPYTGTLRHRGWRVVDLSLAQAVAAAKSDLHVVAPAEVEL
jgi:hypothetical protein